MFIELKTSTRGYRARNRFSNAQKFRSCQQRHVDMSLRTRCSTINNSCNPFQLNRFRFKIHDWLFERHLHSSLLWSPNLLQLVSSNLIDCSPSRCAILCNPRHGHRYFTSSSVSCLTTSHACTTLIGHTTFTTTFASTCVLSSRAICTSVGDRYLIVIGAKWLSPWCCDVGTAPLNDARWAYEG